MARLNRWPRPICLDGRMLDAQATGVGTYAETLLETLRSAGAEPLVLQAQGRPLGRLARWLGAARLPPRFVRFDEAEGRLVGGAELFREAQIFFNLHRRPMPLTTAAPPGVMHWTYPVPLHLKGWRNVYTVHDAIPLTEPGLTPIDRRRHARLLAAIAGCADRLLTVSVAARSDIVAALACHPDLVVCAHQGVRAPLAGAPLPHGLTPGGFFLFCGSIEPRKNLVRLVQAHEASGSGRPLVIAGPDGWRAPEILAETAARPGVIRLNYQSRASLDALICAARALLFPSLSEGFGLPVIEAMLAGAAVMASDRPAVKEIAGEAALLIDPEDCASMAKAIARLDQDDALIASLSSAGRINGARFSIPAYAARLEQVYAELAESKP